MKSLKAWGVRQNNLKSIEVTIPLGQTIVICGPSGSGKSSLAFETLFAEGQRRFVESMSHYARQFLNKAPKPDLDGIVNVPPAIAIEQKNSVRSSRSNVGTVTELLDYLRLLLEKLGVPHCPEHQVPCLPESVGDATDYLLKNFLGERVYLTVSIREKDRVLEGKKLHAHLLQEGFLRILSDKLEVLDISTPEAIKKGLPKKEFRLLIDRFAVKSDDRNRIADSISQAYAASIQLNKNKLSRSCEIIKLDGQKKILSEEAACPICQYTPPATTARLFHFNSPVGACPDCKGFGNILKLDPKKVIPNEKLSIAQGALQPFTMPSSEREKKDLMAFCKKQKINVNTPWAELGVNDQKKIWEGGPGFIGVEGLFAMLEEIKYKMHVRVFISRYRTSSTCPSCQGSRLRREANQVFFKQQNIKMLNEMTLLELKAFFDGLILSKYEQEVAGEVIKQIKDRLEYLVRVGLFYLTLGRETRTLSGGEYQRIMLANQLGTKLSQTMYVLDEPTIGLHPRDNDRLISIMKDIEKLGNTVVIVEHDADVIHAASQVIEMGPGSGGFGGQIVFHGSQNDFLNNQKSLTAPYITGVKSVALTHGKRPVDLKQYKYLLELQGCSGHNLKNITVQIPLRRFVVVTGVSGSGKSTLISKTLYPALAKELDIEYLPSLPFKKIVGAQHLKNVLLIDQSPIGKSARSSAITYLKAFDAIRTLFAALPESKVRGYTAGTFSLNVDGGRCPSCRGTGYEEVDMMFMDNLILPCDVCDGKKYKNEMLEIEFKGKNISQVLDLTVSDAMQFFIAQPNIRKPLSLLKEVGLDYLRIGQPATTLSGGESQRLKIAKELLQASQAESTLYILDEPTTGLHFREVELLLTVLGKLVEQGGSVLVVEHNQDVIAEADFILDLGPDAGSKGGGEVVFAGTPKELVDCSRSLTGQYLKRYLASRKDRRANA